MAALTEEGVRLAAADAADARAQLVGALPLASVAGIAAGADTLVVTGARLPDHAAIAIEVDRFGSVLGEHALPLAAELAQWPRPLPAPEGVEVVWETAGSEPRLWAAELGSSSLGPPRSVPLTEPSVEIDAAPFAGGVLFARTHGLAKAIELVALDGDTTPRALAGARHAVAPSLAPLGATLALLWIASAEGAVLARLLPETPDGGRAGLPLASIAPPARLRRLVVAADPSSPRAAFAYEAVEPGDPAREPAAGRLPRYEQHVALLDASGAAGPPLRIEPSSTAPFAAGWAGGRLVVVHGAIVSVVRAAA